MDPHLTQPNKLLAEQQAKTFPGQAHWATTGPAGAICQQCEHWGLRGTRADYYANGSGLKPRPCAKFKALSAGKQGAAVPAYAPSCRHYVEHPNPPKPYDDVR